MEMKKKKQKTTGFIFNFHYQEFPDYIATYEDRE